MHRTVLTLTVASLVSYIWVPNVSEYTQCNSDYCTLLEFETDSHTYMYSNQLTILQVLTLHTHNVLNTDATCLLPDMRHLEALNVNVAMASVYCNTSKLDAWCGLCHPVCMLQQVCCPCWWCMSCFAT